MIMVVSRNFVTQSSLYFRAGQILMFFPETFIVYIIIIMATLSTFAPRRVRERSDKSFSGFPDGKRMNRFIGSPVDVSRISPRLNSRHWTNTMHSTYPGLYCKPQSDLIIHVNICEVGTFNFILCWFAYYPCIFLNVWAIKLRTNSNNCPNEIEEYRS